MGNVRYILQTDFILLYEKILVRVVTSVPDCKVHANLKAIMIIIFINIYIYDIHKIS